MMSLNISPAIEAFEEAGVLGEVWNVPIGSYVSLKHLANGRVVGTMAQVLDQQQVKHGPLREGDCSGCHTSGAAAASSVLRLYGRDVTTAQIAMAAGTAEGTLFRVFPDKESLIQAAIAAVHSHAETADATDWNEIVGLYDVLLRLQPSPVVELNRAVAVAMRDGFEAGLALVDGILGRGQVPDGGCHRPRPPRDNGQNGPLGDLGETHLHGST